MGVLFLLRTILLDVGFPALDIGTDLYNGITFIFNDDTWWGGFTLFFVFIPGFLELLIISLNSSKFSVSERWYYLIVFGPIFFPLSVIGWNFQMLWRGESYQREEYSRSLVFRSLEAFGESAPQLLLQTTILILTWDRVSVEDSLKGYLQMLSIVSSLFFLSKTSAEHHINELSGKEKFVGWKDWIWIVPFFWINVVLRTFLLAILISYTRWWITLYFSFTAICLMITSRLVFCQYYFGKDLWTGLCSIVGLTCYVGKDDVAEFGESKCKSKFYFYYLLNTIITTILGGIQFAFIHLMEYTCEQTPVFSCFKPTLNTTLIIQNPACRICENGEERHDYFKGVIIPIWITLAILHIVIVAIPLSIQIFRR